MPTFKRFFLATLVSILLLSFINATPALAKVVEGSAFPTMTLPLLSATGTLDLASFKGKVVIYDFWASWCEPCKIELPALDKLYKQYKAKGLVVVGVNMDENAADARDFLKTHPLEVPLVADGKAQALVKKLDIDKMPTSFIVGRNGKVAERAEAYTAGDDKKIEAKIQTLLGK